MFELYCFYQRYLLLATWLGQGFAPWDDSKDY